MSAAGGDGQGLVLIRGEQGTAGLSSGCLESVWLAGNWESLGLLAEAAAAQPLWVLCLSLRHGTTMPFHRGVREARRGGATCPRPHSFDDASLGPGSLAPGSVL